MFVINIDASFVKFDTDFFQIEIRFAVEILDKIGAKIVKAYEIKPVQDLLQRDKKIFTATFNQN